MFRDRFKPKPDDFMVVVMGPTGSGKTNFVSALTGNAEQHRAGYLQSHTQSIVPHIISHHGTRLVLVDTPGFDDTYRPDTEILKVIADWLIQQYSDGTTLKIAGILYLHRISDNRMSGSAYKNLQMFGRLCGDIPLPRVRLVTTMWDVMQARDVARQREIELLNEFWKALIDDGAVCRRFYNSTASAWSILEDILINAKGDGELLLQEELVEQQKRLNETEAGKVLYSRLQRLLAEQKKTPKELAEGAKSQNDPELAKSLQEEYDNIDAQLQKTFEDIREMKIPLSRRILLWLFRRKSRAKAIELDFD